MKRIVYEEIMKNLEINLEYLNIVIGRKTNVPFSIGCYEEDKKWFLYSVGERQNLSIIQQGDEDRIFKFLYMITLGKMKR